MMRLITFLFIILAIRPQNQVQQLSLDNITEIKELVQQIESESFYSDICFSPDGKILTAIKVNNKMSLVHDGTVTFLDTLTLEELPLFKEPLNAMSIAYSSDGSLLALGDQSGQLTVIDTSSWRPEFEIQIDDGEISDVAIDPTNAFVGAAIGTLATVRNNEYALKVVDLASGDTVVGFKVSDSPLQYGADGASIAFLSINTVAFATTDGIMRIWNIEPASEIFQAQGVVSQVRDLSVQNNGQKMIYINGDDVTFLSNTDKSYDVTQSIALAQQDLFVQAIALHPSEPILAVGFFKRTPRPDGGPSATNAGIIRLYNTTTGDELVSLDVPEGAITSLAFSLDGTLLASGGTDGTLRLWGIPADS
jgi:WD40 repeat protein